LAQQRFAKAELSAFAIPDARLKWQARIGSVFQRQLFETVGTSRNDAEPMQGGDFLWRRKL
jgi:hypothetical protein